MNSDWSKHHRACSECGQTDKPYRACGLCSRCYNKQPKIRAYYEAWRSSERGRESLRAAFRKYHKTEKGRASAKKYEAKRRGTRDQAAYNSRPDVVANRREWDARPENVERRRAYMRTERARAIMRRVNHERRTAERN